MKIKTIIPSTNHLLLYVEYNGKGYHFKIKDDERCVIFEDHEGYTTDFKDDVLTELGLVLYLKELIKEYKQSKQ